MALFLRRRSDLQPSSGVRSTCGYVETPPREGQPGPCNVQRTLARAPKPAYWHRRHDPRWHCAGCLEVAAAEEEAGPSAAPPEAAAPPPPVARACGCGGANGPGDPAQRDRHRQSSVRRCGAPPFGGGIGGPAEADNGPPGPGCRFAVMPFRAAEPLHRAQETSSPISTNHSRTWPGSISAHFG